MDLEKDTWGLTRAQVRSLTRAGLVGASGAGGPFRDAAILRAAGELARSGVPWRRVVRALVRLAPALTGVRVSAQGREVVVSDDVHVFSLETGQGWLDFQAPGVVVRALDEDDADRAYDRGCALEGEDPEAAIVAYRQALELDPDHTDAHVNLGRLLHLTGKMADAEEHYRRALELSSQDAVGWFNLAVLLEDSGRLGDAVAAYDRTLELDPDFADAEFNLSKLHERLGDRGAAFRHLAAYRRLTG